ncbi:MAG TPA: thioredoxin domain-containing protein [Acidimicrobiia bacterium]|nr:thioredoxin domain-containing protein [Acidimicrobiia bacterium]
MPNRLAAETSPYLLQHADNPVDWYPWGEEAFAEARRRGRPILLSVGYSSCHWCHVMAHESFEDHETARVMNELFVNVKVDREERPDVDAIYMEAVQAMTGRGGWPMTVFLTPDGEPFFAGTYFPPDDRHGHPSFLRVMGAVSEAWVERRSEVVDQAGRLAATIGQRVEPTSELPDRTHLEAAYRRIVGNADATYGGFGGAPKFPQQPSLEFLLRTVDEEWASEARSVLGHALSAMAAGGIRDHVGGGFARYSVDREWEIPHFEKMLYDNAQLARLYLWGWRELGVAAFRDVAIDTIEYVLRDLTGDHGGFLSAEDADSEGEEGRFYVWSLAEFLEVAGPDDGPAVAALYGVTEGGNFEGANHLRLVRELGEVAADHGTTPEALREAVGRVRRRLFERREGRVRPGLDDKVVTAWNGLMLRALAEAGAALGEDRYLEAARANARFVLSELRDGDERLLRSWGKGRTSGRGFLEDHGAYALGLLALYQATGETEWFVAARDLVDTAIERFADPDGGWFSTADDAEALITRPRDVMDNPSPSGSSLLAEAAQLVGLLTGDHRYTEAVERSVLAAGQLIDRYPQAVGHLLGVVHTMVRGPKELAVVGPAATELASVASERYRPHVAVAMASGEPDGTVPLLADRYRDGETLAYVCEDFACLAPVGDAEALRGLL